MSDQSREPPVMTVFAGPNGAGKSTLRDVLLSTEFLGAVIDADEIARRFRLTSVAAGREVIRLVDECLAAGESFCLESTLSGKLILQQMTRAKKTGYQVRLIFIALPTPEDHMQRIAQRVARGGHDIPDDDVIRRYTRSLNHLPKAADLADHVTIYTNAQECKLVLRLEHGNVIVRHRDCPSWAIRALDHLALNASEHNRQPEPPRRGRRR